MTTISEVLPTLADAREVHTQLIQAKALISDPNGWCKGALTETDGFKVRYCARGAVGKVCGVNVEGGFAAEDIVKTKADAVMGIAANDLFQDFDVPVHYDEADAYVLVNNAKQHEDVMMMFDRGILLAEKRVEELRTA